MKQSSTWHEKRVKEKREAGFSLAELMIAMGITMVIMVGASTLLTKSLGSRSRENRKSDALADVQRGLNIMSREISNSGFGLFYDNGIVLGASDSNGSQIHFRANIDNSNLLTNQPGEDVTYFLTNSTLARYDKNAGQTTALLANRIDTLRIDYYDVNPVNGTVAAVPNNPATPTVNTVRLKITVSVTLPPLQGEPASTEQLTSEVTLRNTPNGITNY